MKDNKCFDALTASDYCDLVLGGDAEAAYYLLKKRLLKALEAVYELHGFGLDMELEDSLDDFYLYLYEGNQTSGIQPFDMVRGIRNKRTFFAWIIATYRHYLINRAKEETRRKALTKQAGMMMAEERGIISNENMIRNLASAIAYADQQFNSRNRFVLYRMLLSFLDHSKAIPQEAMAQAMGMQPVTYRVCSKRQKDRLLEYIQSQESGASLSLDVDHGMMRDRIVDGFERLYELLLEYYDKALDDLPQADAVNALRLQQGDPNGMMHEGKPAYGYVNCSEISTLYLALKHYLEAEVG